MKVYNGKNKLGRKRILKHSRNGKTKQEYKNCIALDEKKKVHCVTQECEASELLEENELRATET